MIVVSLKKNCAVRNLRTSDPLAGTRKRNKTQ